MCGIACYLGKKRKASFLIDVLKRLEYRGYDSSGYANLTENGFVVIKKSGSIANLENSLNSGDFVSAAISHTRWATHGEPNEENAHPHLSANNIWAVVHNGIIENYLKLKSNLIKKPSSQTDTAVVSQFLEENKVNNIFDFIDAFNFIAGSYAIVALNKNIKDTLFLAKNKNPLYISINDEGDFLVASDPSCFYGFSKSYYSFDDKEFAILCKNSVKFYDKNKKEIIKHKNMLDDEIEFAKNEEYNHFMLKEIFEQKEKLQNQINHYKNGVLTKFDDWFLTKFNDIKFIGCGTAFHAGLMGAKFVHKILNKNASCETASEFIYNEPNFISNKTLYIFVSQSGETADTLQALELVKQKNCICVALTNVLYSSLAKKADYLLPICAGQEIAVASTKAYVCMLSAIYMFCYYFKGIKEFFVATENLKNLANHILDFDKEKIKDLSNKIKDKKEAIFIGKDMDYITALEASLKLKEVSYINANAYPSGELKHGFLALVQKDTPLFVFANIDKTNQKTLSSKSEAEARGAESIVFSNSDDVCEINIKEKDSLLAQIEAIVPMQYLAYLTSVSKNINPDKPRNLAKSVTVE